MSYNPITRSEKIFIDKQSVLDDNQPCRISRVPTMTDFLTAVCEAQRVHGQVRSTAQRCDLQRMVSIHNYMAVIYNSFLAQTASNLSDHASPCHLDSANTSSRTKKSTSSLEIIKHGQTQCESHAKGLVGGQWIYFMSPLFGERWRKDWRPQEGEFQVWNRACGQEPI